MIRVSGHSKSRPVKAAGAESRGHKRNQKLHAAVAKNKFLSQNVKKTDGLGALFEVLMSKHCTPLWRKAHFEAKKYKTPHSRSTFEALMSKNCMQLWREEHFQVKNVKN